MKIALVQQYAGEDVDANRSNALRRARSAAESGAEIIAFAELGFLPFLPQNPAGPDFKKYAEPVPGPTTEMFSALAKEFGIVIVLNLFEESDGRTYDSSPVINTDGTIAGITRMVHIMDGLGFHEKGYYTPGDLNTLVHDTKKGRVGIAICYDRHFPEYMRQLGLLDPDIVFVPQAGTMDEWPAGIFEAELQVASFQNGYFAALANRVGKEEKLHFSGESFITDPFGQVIAQAPRGEEAVLFADCDFSKRAKCAARRFFLPDRRPAVYRQFQLLKD
ncbi:MAG: carbon-nitrogen hydrolase family protein [Acidobacteria bacterium]|nr:carbon-nitrogen hydrolase family protein [Acidobacteriota bacterium]MBU2438764.1 carbon-nitrogen hydrolase family protein [Acidobacteriota bacterium]MBU4330487.1 carbon-nitrogen hydrolase family protein [Acidobacteriota bacterium]MCG2814983.1 carbon-nitrogen hydrolase family protein [Candidatus Aminicenantes bacterium]